MYKEAGKEKRKYPKFIEILRERRKKLAEFDKRIDAVKLPDLDLRQIN